MYIIMEVVGLLGLLALLLAGFTGEGFWNFQYPAAGKLIYTSLWGAGAWLFLLGLAAWAMVFLRFGFLSPASALQRVGRLELSSEVPAIPTRPAGAEDLQEEEFELTTAEQFIGRLQQEIENQGNRANLNLVVGGLTALVALVFLVWATVDTSQRLEAAIGMSGTRNIGAGLQSYLYWGPFASKLFMSSTAAFFAFFFLSTYRRNLAEIRYFHNELTNVEARVLAAELCGETAEGTAARLEILKVMGATERNFILRKGESTTDLAQKELDRQETAAWVEVIVQALNKAQAHKA